MIGSQSPDPQTQPPIYRGRIDWWGFLRGLILLLSSVIGLSLLYSIWNLLLG